MKHIYKTLQKLTIIEELSCGILSHVLHEKFILCLIGHIDFPGYIFCLIGHIDFPKAIIKSREKYQDTPGSSSIYQNALGSSKFTKLPLCPKKYTL